MRATTKNVGSFTAYACVAAYVVAILLFIGWVAAGAAAYANIVAHYCPNSYSVFNATYGGA